MPHWQAFKAGIESSRGPRSGRLSALRFGPGVDGPHTLWVGASSGGLWEYASGSAIWHARSADLLGSPAVGDFVFSDVLVLATGDPWRYPGSGIYRREAGDWRLAEMPEVPSAVYRLAVDRDADQRLFAATPQGLWRSLDGGRSWQRSRPGHYTDIVQDPHKLTRWYAGEWGSGVWRSLDGGATFTAANGSAITAPIGRVSLAASEAQASLVFALVSDGTGTHGVFRSTDAAASWVSIDGGPDVSWGQAFHANAITADPNDPQHLVVAQGGAKHTREALAASPQWHDLGDTGHADTTRLAWDASGALWASNDGGVHRLDLGTSGIDSSRNVGLPTLQVFGAGSLAVDPEHADRAWVGLQDNGVVRAEAGSSGRLVAGIGCCDGGWVSATRHPPGRLAAMLGLPFSRWLSNSAGDSFSRLGCAPASLPANTPLAFDPQSPTAAAAHLYSAVQLTSTGAAQLQRTDLSRPCAQATFGFMVPDGSRFVPDFISIATDPERLVVLISPAAGSSDPRYVIARSAPGAPNALTLERQPPPLAGRSGRIVADPHHRNRVWWWTLDGAPRVFRSDAYGLPGSWVDATGDLAFAGDGLRIRRVMSHPDDGSILLASSLGLLASSDHGSHWQIDHVGLPRVVDAVDLATQRLPGTPHTTRTWLATYGHGLWWRDRVELRVFVDGFE